MDIKKISKDFSVAPQLSVNDITLIKAQGFASVINNRPDAEQEGQVEGRLVGSEVSANGLNYTHQPVVGSNITDANITEFKRLFDTAEKPLLAFCRTGTRCTMLWALANAQADNIDALIAQAAAAGYDIAALRARMVQLANA